MTHGHHCGYISPIPQFHFNDKLTEEEFRIFIEAISNNIINWDSIKAKMNDGGVTYADLDIINSEIIEVAEKTNGMKFISGANLGFNLKNLDKLFPFYNPRGARGEDTFLSTGLGEHNKRKVSFIRIVLIGWKRIKRVSYKRENYTADIFLYSYL